MSSGLGVRMVTAIAKSMRTVGKSLDNMGKGMEVAKYTEKLVPSTRFVAVDGVAPSISDYGVFVAPSASVIGDVSIGRNSSVWYGATVRGDVHSVSIGERTNIMEHAVVHVAKIQGDAPTSIGSNVTIGAGAMIHAATVKDLCIIGESAQVMDNATVESNSIVDAGAVVTPHTVVPSGELWAGAPAKKIRNLTPEEIASIPQMARDNMQLAAMHIIENAKDFKTILEEEEYIDFLDDDPDPLRHEPEGAVSPDGHPSDLDSPLGEPGQIFNSTLTDPVEGLRVKLEREEKGQ